MSEIRIARRYAKALFEKAHEDKALDAVVADVLNIQKACAESQDLVVFLNSPMLRKGVKKDALSKIFDACSSLTKQLMLLMTDKNRESYIPGMADEFMVFYNKFKGITTAEVTSAVTLSEKALDAVKKYVAQVSGANDVVVVQRIDPSVIGGMNIVFDGKIFDATISNQIIKLKKDLQIA
jgi:F-type H+-transporting ATPase subunit delta